MAWYDLKGDKGEAVSCREEEIQETTKRITLLQSLDCDMKILVRRQEGDKALIKELYTRIDDLLDHLNLEYKFTPSTPCKTELVKKKGKKKP